MNHPWIGWACDVANAAEQRRRDWRIVCEGPTIRATMADLVVLAKGSPFSQVLARGAHPLDAACAVAVRGTQRRPKGRKPGTSALQVEILALLRGGPMATPALVAALERSKPVVRGAIDALVLAGKVAKVGTRPSGARHAFVWGLTGR